MSVITEREILTNVLRKFRDLPCLWDKHHEHYNNKVKRSEAFARLLTMYRFYEPKANLLEFKKKLENMRTAYRRIRIKVMKARARGEDYEPSLWYYKELTFLNETLSDHYTEYERLELGENEEETEEVDYLKSESRSNSPPPPPKKRTSNFVFVNEGAGSVKQTDMSTIMDRDLSKNNLDASSSVEFFGRTVASQLDELQPIQRYIAEKLISEIIFYARLDKLSTETSINLSDEQL